MANPARKLSRKGYALLLTLLIAVALCATQQALHPRQPQPNQPAELYSTQLRDDLRRLFIDAIDSAKDEVVLSSYGLSDARILHALRNKAAEGIPVHVIVDRKASAKAHRLLGPDVHTLRRSAEGLMHIKALIIDQQRTWIGSANFTFPSLRIHANLMVGMESKALSLSLRNYLLDLPVKGRHSPPDMPISFQLNKQTGDLWMLPQKQALDSLLEQIQSAKHSLQIAMFTWTHPTLTQAVIKAHQRGVHVHIVIDRDQGHGTGSEVVHTLREAGIPTYLSDGDGLLHHKLALIDQTTLIVGSANWTRSAFKRNDDCLLILTPITQEQQTQLEKLWTITQHDVEYPSPSHLN